MWEAARKTCSTNHWRWPLQQFLSSCLGRPNQRVSSVLTLRRTLQRVLALGRENYPSYDIPSSCASVWPDIWAFSNPVMIGWNCAIVANGSPYDLWIHRNCGGNDTCNSLSSLYATRYSEDYSQFAATGTITSTTSFSVIFLARDGRPYVSRISGTSHNPSWSPTRKPPYYGSYMLNGGTV